MTAPRRSPFEVARRIGQRAALQGRSPQSNPYDGKAYRAAWLDGFRAERAHLIELRQQQPAEARS